MVERTVSLGGSGADIAALKEMIYAQQELLQKLHVELDTEREASSTSTNEALSMILKLQAEKAALTMEASQYKRMAEEKMSHAETSLALFEDLIYQKEMEIASFEFQVQAYRCKLLSLGCDPGAGENKFPENLMLQTNRKGSSIRRLQSLPAIGLDDSYGNRDGIEEENPFMLDFVHQDKELGVDDESLDPKKPLEDSNVRDIDSCWELIRKNSHDGNLNSRWDPVKENPEEVSSHIEPEKKNPEQSYGGEMVSYWDEINKLDDRVREISELKDDRSDNNKYTKLKRESRTRLLVSQVSTSILESTRSEITSNLEKMKKSDKLLCREASVGPINSSSIHDIFEVPNSVMQKGKHCSDEDNRFDFKDRLGKPDLVVEEIVEPNAEKAAALVRVSNDRRRFAKPPRDLVGSGGRRKNIARTTTSLVDYQAEIQNLNLRIEQLEGNNRINMTNEISGVGRVGGAWLLLLKEINEKVNSIQSEVKSWRPNESSPQEEEALNSIKEAMLYFWF